MTLVPRSLLLTALAATAGAQQLEPVFLASQPEEPVAQIADDGAEEVLLGPAAELPYGDIVVADDEASLDLRTTVEGLAPLLLQVLGDLNGAGMDSDAVPSDIWMEVRGTWLRVEPLPYKPGWTRVRLRVGSFSADDIDRAADLLSELAGLVAAEEQSAEAEEQNAAPGGGVLTAAPAASSFDPGWVAAAYDVAPPVQEVHHYHWVSYSPAWIWSPGFGHGGFGGGWGWGGGWGAWDDDIWFGYGSTAWGHFGLGGFGFGGFGHGGFAYGGFGPWGFYDPYWWCDPYVDVDVVVIVDDHDDAGEDGDGTVGDGRGDDAGGTGSPSQTSVARRRLALADAADDARGGTGRDEPTTRTGGDGIGGLPADTVRTSTRPQVASSSTRLVVVRRSTPTRVPVALPSETTSRSSSRGGIRVVDSSSSSVSVGRQARSVRMPSIAVARYPQTVQQPRAGMPWDGGATSRGTPSDSPWPSRSGAAAPWSPWAGAPVGGSGLPRTAQTAAPLPSSAASRPSPSRSVQTPSSPSRSTSTIFRDTSSPFSGRTVSTPSRSASRVSTPSRSSSSSSSRARPSSGGSKARSSSRSSGSKASSGSKSSGRSSSRSSGRSSGKSSGGKSRGKRG